MHETQHACTYRAPKAPKAHTFAHVSAERERDTEKTIFIIKFWFMSKKGEILAHISHLNAPHLSHIPFHKLQCTSIAHKRINQTHI